MNLEKKIKSSVLLSSLVSDDETQNLEFLSDSDGVYICSFRVEKYGDELNYFNLQLTFEEFQNLLSQLAQLIPQNLDKPLKLI